VPKYGVRVRDRKALRSALKTPGREAPDTVRSLADAVGVNRTTIGDLLTGDQERLSEAAANRIAGALACPFDELFELDESVSADADEIEGRTHRD